jgi:hypothetical protein
VGNRGYCVLVKRRTIIRRLGSRLSGGRQLNFAPT